MIIKYARDHAKYIETDIADIDYPNEDKIVSITYDDNNIIVEYEDDSTPETSHSAP